MPTYYRRDDSVQNGLGQAVPNVAVTYYTEPGLGLATVYSGPSGGAATNPQYTNGLGQAAAYMPAGQYTITYSGSQIQTLTFPDQNVGSSGSGSTIVPFAGTPVGAINGTNRVFQVVNGSTPLTAIPNLLEAWLNYSQIPGTDYTLAISGGLLYITYANAPQPASGSVPADVIYAQGIE
jgi:hypothetical protein